MEEKTDAISILNLVNKCEKMFEEANDCEIDEIDFNDIKNFEKVITVLEDKTNKLYELTTVLRKIKEFVDRVTVIENEHGLHNKEE